MRIEPRQIMFIHKIKSIMLRRLQKIHREWWPVFAFLRRSIYFNQFKYFFNGENGTFQLEMH